MILPFIFIIISLALLVWSAGYFVDGSSITARHLGMPPLLIGMLIVGFGTSAPEMMVSVLSSWQGNPGIALGNAYGSNICNIALILGLTALISPIAFQSNILRKELPILALVTLLAVFQVWDGAISRLDAIALLTLFSGLVGWSIIQGVRRRDDHLAKEIQTELATGQTLPLRKAIFRMFLGLLLLIASSRALVWAAIEIARGFGVPDLLIGLTIVAVGTSLPELASSVAAAIKREHDIALGNILGSNLFNTLAVVGLAGIIRPIDVPAEILSRDMPMVVFLTLSLFVIGFGFRGPGRINRIEGGLLLVAFVAYTIVLAGSVTG